MKNKTQNIHVVATSVTGPYHRAKKQPCQDCYRFLQRGRKMVAVISDGAGSAKYSKIGARTVCNILCDILISNQRGSLQQKIINALEIARQKLVYHRWNKSKSESGLVDFAATVVGVICTPEHGMFFHIGDGAAIALGNKLPQGNVVSMPENGLFSCETYFFTMDDWRDSLRFTTFEKADSLILMTDGVTGFAFNKDMTHLEKGFIEPINRFLHNESDKHRALRALNNTLSTPQACKLNSDDKTLLWAKLK